MNRAFKGVWIPKEVWTSDDLSLQEKALITEIDSLDNEGGCFASNKYFAGFMNLSERQIKRMIQSLTDKKWITSKIIYKENSKEIEKRILRICRPPYPEIIGSDKNDTTLVTEMVKGSDKNDTTPSDKNGLDNNTYINNTNNSKDIEKIIQIYNFCCPHLPKVQKVTEKRKKAIRTFLKEFSIEQFEKICKIANISNFLIGKNDKGWKADFDFLMRVDKATSVLEGKYSDNNQTIVEQELEYEEVQMTEEEYYKLNGGKKKYV